MAGKQDGRPGGATKVECLFCSKDGHTVEKCYKFQKQSYLERKKFVSIKGLCNICLTKGHFASQCQKGRNCFIAGCGKRHQPLLHMTESNDKGSECGPVKAGEKESIGTKDMKVPDAQTGHCGASDARKRQVCLQVIPVRVFSQDNSHEKVTYAIQDEGSNTTLVKESLARELKLEGQPLDFKLATMNNVSLESGKAHRLYVQGVDQKDVIEIPNMLSIKSLSVARSCIPTRSKIEEWSHLDGIHMPEAIAVCQMRGKGKFVCK